MRTGVVLAGPVNYVMQLRRTCCNPLVTILMQGTQAAARDLGIRHHIDVWQILNDNHLPIYNFQNVQDLLPIDYLHRQQFAR